MIEIIQEIDWQILHWIQNTLGCPFLNSIMPIITILGSGGAIWIAWAIILFITKKYRKNSILLIAGLLLGYLIGNLLLKNVIVRERPFSLDETIKLLITAPDDYSFPSGHTLSSVIGATILTMSNKKFGFAAIPLAFLIAFSRLYLCVHFPSDIIFAALLGVLLGAVAYIGGMKIYDRKINKT